MGTNINTFKSSGSSIPPMEPGTYPAVCCAVIDIGMQKTSFEGKERETPQLILIWEFPEEQIEINGEMKPRHLSRTYTASVNEKSRLRADLKSWRGRDFTEDELADFDIARVLGAPCIITVTQTSKGGNTYANMSGVSKLMKGMVVQPPLERKHFDMDDENTWPVFAKLPEWIQDKINESITFAERNIRLDKEGHVIDRLLAGGPSPSDDSMGDEVYTPDDDLPF